MQTTPANPLSEYFFNNPGRMIHKWHHYFEIYHRHFEKFRGQSPVVVEIGVFHGGSLQMWREYFGPGTRVVGIDIDPRCKGFEDESTTILIGDQADRGFLAEVRKAVPRIDILIDDGGHTMQQQIATLEELSTLGGLGIPFGQGQHFRNIIQPPHETAPQGDRLRVKGRWGCRHLQLA